MRNYQALISEILTHGEKRTDRTGVGTLSLYGRMLQWDLRAGFPATTTKKLAFKTMAAELACFVKGLTDIREFWKRDCHIWDANWKAWNAEHGLTEGMPGYYDMGKIYGAQWRAHGDQLRTVIDAAKANPDSRRLLVNAWDASALGDMCLPPCHTHWQISIRNHGTSATRVDLAFYMRSVDVMLGLPFDVASYALLCELIAMELGMSPGILTCFAADAHIYLNHVDNAKVLLEREPRPLPCLVLPCQCISKVEDFEPQYAELTWYNPHPALHFDMAV